MAGHRIPVLPSPSSTAPGRKEIASWLKAQVKKDLGCWLVQFLFWFGWLCGFFNAVPIKILHMVVVKLVSCSEKLRTSNVS